MDGSRPNPRMMRRARRGPLMLAAVLGMAVAAAAWLVLAQGSDPSTVGPSALGEFMDSAARHREQQLVLPEVGGTAAAEGTRTVATSSIEHSDVTLAGRLRDVRGKLLANEVAMATLVLGTGGPGSRRATRLDTDEQGRFRLQLPSMATESAERSVIFNWYPSHARSRRPRQAPAQVTTLALRTVSQEGTHELGDVRLAGLESVVRGRAIDASGRPVAGAHIALESEWPSPLPGVDATWREIQGARALSNANGCFEVHGVAPANEGPRPKVRVHGWKPGLCSGARCTVESGECTLVLAATGSVAGSVLPHPRYPLSGVTVALTRVSPASDIQQEPRGGITRRLSPEPDGTFEFDGLKPGNWSFELRARTPAPLLVVGEIEVGAGEANRHPRIQALELARWMGVAELEVVDSDDKLLHWATARLRPRDGTQGSSMTALASRPGAFLVPFGAEPPEVVVRCPGFATEWLHELRSDQRLTMQKSPRLRVFVRGARDVARGDTRLGINVRRDPARHEKLAGWCKSGVAIDRDGTLEVALPGSGTWMLEWTRVPRDWPRGGVNGGNRSFGEFAATVDVPHGVNEVEAHLEITPDLLERLSSVERR